MVHWSSAERYPHLPAAVLSHHQYFLLAFAFFNNQLSVLIFNHSPLEDCEHSLLLWVRAGVEVFASRYGGYEWQESSRCLPEIASIIKPYSSKAHAAFN